MRAVTHRRRFHGRPRTCHASGVFRLFDHLVAHVMAKVAITEALLDAGGDRDGDAARASQRLHRAVSALFRNAQQAGAIRADVELPEVYALLVGASRAAARARLDEEARARLFAIVFDGLAPGQRPARDRRDRRASN